MSTSTWRGADGTDWADPDNWSPAGVPGAGSDVTIAAAEAVASASIGTVNSIDDSGSLRFRSAGTNSVATFLDISGGLRVDREGGDGGTILDIAGALSNSGSLRIGNATLSVPDEVTAASLDNAGGGLRLLGSGASQALLNMSGSAGFGAAGILSGYVRLAGDSAIEFASGEITSVNGSLHLNGSEAFIEDSAAWGSNSALMGLASIGTGATFELENKASVSTTGALVNDGHVYLDTHGGDGGSSLNIGGTLTNYGSLIIGNEHLSTSDKVTVTVLDNLNRAAHGGRVEGSISLKGSGANQALLDVIGSAGFGAAEVLSGNVRLAGDSAIEFNSGQITRVDSRAQLRLNGKDAFVEDSTALGSNSALTGLASIGTGATFELENKATVSTTGALVNDGFIFLDLFGGDGGSSLTVTGTLTNNSSLHGGSLRLGNTTLSAADKVTAASLDNTGSIVLTGSDANQALLDVIGSAGFGAAEVLSGFVQLAGDSAIEFGSGEITSLAANAQLHLGGNDAFIEDSTALGSNSALTGLASIGAEATLNLEESASLSTTGALVNDGFILLDLIGGAGGTILNIGGTLTNSDGLDIGNATLAASDEVAVASLDNTGDIVLDGSSANQALLEVTGTAGFGTAKVLSGNVDLSGDSAVEFGSGEITSLTGSLNLNGNDAFIEDSTALGSNSALTGLASIGGVTEFYLDNKGSVSIAGALVNDGNVYLDGGDIGDGGSSLTVAATLTNNGTLNIGNSGISSSDHVTAKSFVNSGMVNLIGSGANFAALNASGATTNDGSISINNDTEELAGPVGGSGSFSLSNADLRFDSTVSAGQTVIETGEGARALTLEQAQGFAGTIEGFGSNTGDTIDAANFLFSGTKFNFAGGALTLRDASLTANIRMIGDYSKSDFNLAPDSGTGTLVKFV